MISSAAGIDEYCLLIICYTDSNAGSIADALCYVNLFTSGYICDCCTDFCADYDSHAVALISARFILPPIVFGSSFVNSIILGYLYGAVMCLTCS